MIASFADEATSDVFNGVNTKEARKLAKDVWLVMRRKLDIMRPRRSVTSVFRLAIGWRL